MSEVKILSFVPKIPLMIGSKVLDAFPRYYAIVVACVLTTLTRFEGMFRVLLIPMK
jgi:hypothetical protein